MRLAALTLCLTAACGAGPDAPPVGDVLLISIDTLRADALSCYGNPAPTTPVLDALAAGGLLFDEALTQAPNTATSHATLFTGLAPWAHRVANLTSLEHGTPGLPPAFITLAERFRDVGHDTAAFTDGGPLGRAWNLMQGFEVLEADFEGAEAKVDQTLEWLDGRPAGPPGTADRAPHFLFLHTYQVHAPFLPPLEYRDRFNSQPAYAGPVLEAELEARGMRTEGGETEPNGLILLRDKHRFTPEDMRYLRDLYLAELAWTDFQLGRLFDRLKERGEWEDLTVIVTSDHGEEFGEHGRWGHVQLHRETLRVPLIVKLPGGSFDDWRGRSIPERVNQVDVHATLIDLLGADWPLDEGRSLLEDLERGAFVERASYAETTEGLYADVQRGQSPTHLRSLRHGDHAFVEREEEGAFLRLIEPARSELGFGERAPDPALFVAVPGETTGDVGLLPILRTLSGRVTAHLDACVRDRLKFLDGKETSFSYQVDDETRGDLEALGYL